MTDTPRQQAAKVIQHYGTQHQLVKLMEECGELIQAAIKAHEIGADVTTDFVGELADVYVLIKQFLATMPTVWRTEFDTYTYSREFLEYLFEDLLKEEQTEGALLVIKKLAELGEEGERFAI